MVRYMSITILIFNMLGCTKTYKLTADDLKLNPYKGGEILVFNSNQGETDTIFVLEVRKHKARIDPLSTVPQFKEKLEVVVQYTNPIAYGGKEERDKDIFFDLSTGENGDISLGFRPKAKNAWFYSPNGYSRDQFEKLPISKLATKKYEYDDVIKLEPDMRFYDRETFVAMVYWSKSKGYVRYDLKNGVYWELQ